MQIQAQSFTVNYKGLVNVLKSDALISRAFNPAATANPPLLRKFIAIWDTGASGTVITQKVIDECKLKPIGMANVITAKGKMTTQVYLVNIVMPNEVGVYNLRATRGNTGKDADILIGMDIIGRGDFAVTGKDGKTTFSFRMPSCDCIDFNKEDKTAIVQKIETVPKPIVANKVGRNDPCPCGSGKKFKKCCGK